MFVLSYFHFLLYFSMLIIIIIISVYLLLFAILFVYFCQAYFGPNMIGPMWAWASQMWQAQFELVQAWIDGPFWTNS